MYWNILPRPVEALEPRRLLSVQLAADIQTDTNSSDPRDFVSLGDGALFFALQVDGKYALWRTDGTAAGTAAFGSYSAPAGEVAVMGDWLYFTASDASGVALFRTDGTLNGTQRVAAPPTPNLTVAHLSVGDGTLYFAISGDVYRITNADPAATRIGFTSGGVVDVKAVGPKVFFLRTFISASGTYLGVTDDSGAGLTAILARTSDFAPFKGKVYFRESTTGNLDVSDGTAGGTRALSPGGKPIAGSNFRVVGDYLYFIATRPDVGREVFRVVDDVPPTVANASFDPAGAGQVRLRMSESVALPPGAAPPTLLNRATGQPVPAGGFAVSYDAGSRTLVVAPTAPLADGDYRLTVPAAYLADAAGNPLAADYTFDFFVLAGDANHDRTVNFPDLVAVAQNYDGVGKTFAQGDLNGDGKVDFADLVLVAQKYDAALPPPATPAALASPPAVPADVRTSAAATAKPVKTLFSIVPVPKPAPRKPKPAARPTRRQATRRPGTRGGRRAGRPGA